MRRNISILSVLLLIFFFSCFQHANAQVKAGVRMGLNYTDLTELRPQDNSGFHLGTYLKLSLAGIVAVEPGAQYSKRKFTLYSNGPTSNVTFNYLDFPLILRLSVFPFVNVFGGPQASVLIGEKYRGPGSYDTRNHLPNQELGGIAGIGVNLPLGFNLQASYDFGLSDLEYDGNISKNRIFKISLGKDF